MADDHILVWDIETIPDLTGFAAANDLVGKTNAEIREVMGSRGTSRKGPLVSRCPWRASSW
jgi:hypothetical protein